MSSFADVQYCIYANIVGGSEINKSFADVTYGCPLTPCSHSASMKINLLTNQILSYDAFFKNLMYATGALNRISWYTTLPA